MKKFSIEINKKLQFNVDLLHTGTDDGYSLNCKAFKKNKNMYYPLFYSNDSTQGFTLHFYIKI